MSERKQFQLNVISIWVGILIPILATAIPYIVTYVIPDHHLEYTITGPISVKSTKSTEIKIRNGGAKLEKNIKLALKTSYLWTLERDKEPLNAITVDTQANFKISHENDWFVVSLGDLRPDESLVVSVMSNFIDITTYLSTEPSGISVKSDENLGQFSGPSEFYQIFCPFGLWMFVLLMILMLMIGIYQQHFMDPKKREELILKEIDKLPKDPRR